MVDARGGSAAIGRRCFVLIAAFCGAATLVGCSTDAPSLPSFDGSYQLRAVNGALLPADRGIIPNPGKDSLDFSQNCRYQIDGGTLRLDMASSTFSLSYTAKNSCNNLRMSTSTLAGSIKQESETRLAFHVPRSGAAPFDFVGTISGNETVVQLPDMALRYGR